MRGGGREEAQVFLFRRKKERQKAIGSLHGNLAISISAPTSRNTKNDLRSGAWSLMAASQKDHRPKGELKGWRGGGEEGKERKGREEQGGEGFATMDRPRSRNRAAIAKGVAVASLEQREAAGPLPADKARRDYTNEEILDQHVAIVIPVIVIIIYGAKSCRVIALSYPSPLMTLITSSFVNSFIFRILRKHEYLAKVKNTWRAKTDVPRGFPTSRRFSPENTGLCRVAFLASRVA
ncbi:hypothetical protein ALC53_04435 [Atta colombica]|uniref:Uncharacterized protein n=1 Tax=Atta colombica TaxID=520822 RepID=A0A195BLK9_9HYME|nr:hypothetical protein ALC53_04435 [Atta colombica]